MNYHVKHVVKDDKLGDLWRTIGGFGSKESAVAFCSGKDPDLLTIEVYKEGELVREYNAEGDCLSHD